MQKNWIASNKNETFNEKVDNFEKIKTYNDKKAGIPVYHIVYTKNGFIIVSGDDTVEPIISFVAQGDFTPSLDNPLGALVVQDLPKRIPYFREIEKRNYIAATKSERDEMQKAQQKWKILLQNDSKRMVDYFYVPYQVGPLITTNWGQKTAKGTATCYNQGQNCYNLSTPNHYVCGCVATAMSQIMRHFSYPTTPIGTHFL